MGNLAFLKAAVPVSRFLPMGGRHCRKWWGFRGPSRLRVVDGRHYYPRVTAADTAQVGRGLPRAHSEEMAGLGLVPRDSGCKHRRPRNSVQPRRRER